ncbi:conserved hypothetical protein [Leishmania mexicana MHOM/GT/2001/U1103]|uniref:ACB domain-containing protein n=1 Tax=Leishmania mexicana (strain MHOM/GT/2001/U1103) TaxID=929439 RepID=E9AU92_LEIMU|nr:conserved hypothetical protein [Leishmania mexicana MHOM/GT/2001/U1103]CBZ26518.1 conserved hypothetical protein [Leishmania mexicana MHOM/GT/2001/U1103]
MELSFPGKYYEVAKYFDYYIGNLEESPLLSDAQRLMFYALRQQADHGQCTTAAPSFWYSRERHKHQAWKQLGRMSTFEAMVFFVQQFEQLLMQLENSTGPSASTSGGATPAGGVDWPSRLREMKANRAPNTGNSPHSSEALASDGARANNDALAVRQGPSPATASEEVCQESSSSKLSAAEMAEWDADVVSHSGATVENIRYLATELMRARHAFRQLLAKSAPSHIQQNGTGASTNGPPIRAGSACLTPSDAAPAAAGPPLKPIWCSNGSAARVPIVPPPVRPSARSMTEAAVRDSCGGPQLKKMPVATDRPLSPSALSTWFNW